MQRYRAALPLATLALAACHVRAIPFSTPPGFSVSKESAEGTLAKKQDVTLSDEDNHYIAAFRYELPAPGGSPLDVVDEPGAEPDGPAGQVVDGAVGPMLAGNPFGVVEGERAGGGGDGQFGVQQAARRLGGVQVQLDRPRRRVGRRADGGDQKGEGQGEGAA